MRRQPPDRVALFCVVITVVCACAAGGTVALGELPPWGPVALLSILLFYAANQHVVVAGEYAQSASLMLALAAVAVFQPTSAYLGPLIVGMVSGLYLPHLRERQWRKVFFNLSSQGLATLAAATVYFSFPSSLLASPGGLLLAAIPTTLAYLLVNEGLVVLVLSLDTRRPLADLVREMRVSAYQSYPFAVLGVFVGRLYGVVGVVIAPLLVVPVLIARQAFGTYIAVRGAQEATVQTLISALEAKDHYTAGHVERVAVYAGYMGEEMGFPLRRLERLRFAALMHDVGKLVVPNQLLNKPGRLTDAEFRRIKEHESVSVEILSRIDFLAPVAASASSEFTKYNKGDDKHPIEPYIVHVADAYDAMTSTRAYRKALTQDVAFAELREKAGTQFHPDCVEALIAAIERRDEHHGSGYETDEEQWALPPPEVGTGSAGLGDLEPSDEKKSSRS